MWIAISGPSGSGKTSLAAELARTCDLRHVEIDALHHGPGPAPALRRCFENRREYPVRLRRYPHLVVHRLRSDRAVRAFVQSIQATASTSGSSNGSERQKTPPFAET